MTVVAVERHDGEVTNRRRLPALDGLRGLAVLAVVFFHTDSHWLAGGYLGVDVFFVLSGFLIADILYRELRTRGSRALPGFWLRRVRRLGPALLVLVAVVSLQRILAPEPGNSSAGPILAAISYTTNWFEIARGGTYFGEFGPNSPLLHTWSLAIEEQFYLAFPLILFGFLAMTRTRKRLAYCMVGLAMLSAVWMAFLAIRGASELRLYMGTDTRAQALLVGAALGLAVGRGGPVARSRTLDLTGWAGLAVLAVTVLVAGSPSSLYLGGFALQAVATAFVISAALRAGSVQSMLSWRPLVWVGTISYSAYLWHFPVFAWIQDQDDAVAPIGTQLWSVVLTLLIAFCSQRFVERPFLQGWIVRWPAIRQWSIYLAASLLLACSTLAPADAFSKSEPMQWPAREALPDSVLIMGDSTAFGLDVFFPANRLPGVLHKGTYELGCGFSALPYSFRGGVADVARCQGWGERTEQSVLEHSPEAAVIQSHAWVAFDRVKDGNAYGPGTPVFDGDFAQTLREAIRIGGDDGRIPVYVLKIGCPAPLFDSEVVGDPQRVMIINALIDRVVAGSPNSSAVQTADVTCRNGRPVEEGKDPGYRDDGMHWTPHGSEVMWNKLAWAMTRNYERPL